jgi:hypothetical protein
MDLIRERLKLAFSLSSDLLNNLDEADLELKVPNVPSNTIGGQYWCIVGARQSYINAIKNGGEWQGFKCDLENAHKKEEVNKLLEETSQELDMLEINLTNQKIMSKLIELLEHEIQHHGQLIRFVYANKLKFPKSWNKRYTV